MVPGELPERMTLATTARDIRVPSVILAVFGQHLVERACSVFVISATFFCPMFNARKTAKETSLLRLG